MSEAILAALLVGVHVLGGGVWIGAMAFNLFVLTPRAERFFGGRSEFEDFIFTVVHGARWQVVAGIAAIVASGAALAWRLGGADVAGPWPAFVLIKVALLLASLALFIHVSWVLWPRRVFASATELPGVRQRFFWIGVAMIACNVVNMGVGFWAHALRTPAG